MSQQDIKSAQQVVSDFLQSLTGKPNLDPKTIIAITNLQAEEKLTNTRLLSALDEIRQEAIGADQNVKDEEGFSDE